MAKHRLPNFRIAVVGAGAIGCYYGGKLAYFGRDVHFLMRSDYEVVRKRGLRIVSKGGDLHLSKVNAYRTTAEIGPVDLVLIAVKSTANAELPLLVRPLVGEKTVILTLQNGLGNEEFLAEHFGAERILGGLCFICLNRIAPGVIELQDNGRVAIGDFTGFPRPLLHDLAWEWKRCGVVCSVVADLALEHWRKLVWNIPFNGLTITAGGVDTSVILDDDALRLKALALMDETIAIARACGHNLPTAVALEQMKRTASMGRYLPSTLLDYRAGRGLELEAIWGEPLRRAREHGVATPELERLHAQLRQIGKEK